MEQELKEEKILEKHNKAKESEELDIIVTHIKNAPNFEVSSKKPRNTEDYIEYNDNGKKRYLYALNK
jgi:hypothetical protein